MRPKPDHKRNGYEIRDDGKYIMTAQNGRTTILQYHVISCKCHPDRKFIAYDLQKAMDEWWRGTEQVHASEED